MPVGADFSVSLSGALTLTEVAALMHQQRLSTWQVGRAEPRDLRPHRAAKYLHPPLPASLSSRSFVSLLSKLAIKTRDGPIPIFGSKAESFRVNDVIYFSPRECCWILLSLSLFCFIMYFGFIHRYYKGNQAAMDFLTSDRNLPEASSQQLAEVDRSES